MVDIENSLELRDYLLDRLAVGGRSKPFGARPTRSFAVDVLSGGVSNRTVRVTFPSGAAWVIKQALDKLRVSIDWFCDPERIHREALGMELLAQLLPRGSVPAMIFEDRANHIVAMEAVREPFSNWKQLLLAGRLRLRHVTRFARHLAAMHVGGLRLRETLPDELSDLTYFSSLRLEPYYRYTASRVDGARTMLEGLVEGYDHRRYTLVHGDFSPKNILVRRGRLILLDHEAIHIGDPAFDLGFSLTHLLSKAHHLRAMRSELLHAAELYWTTYLASSPPGAQKAWGADFVQRSVRHTLGCMLARVAGRSQLEYLSVEEKERQCRAVLELVGSEPRSIEELISRFARALGRPGSPGVRRRREGNR